MIKKPNAGQLPGKRGLLKDLPFSKIIILEETI